MNLTETSSFQPVETFRSPHFSPTAISVEFLILHYTAQSLQGSLDIFLSKEGPKVSSHLLIDEEGQIYELVKCWNGVVQKSFHAGESRWKDSSGKIWRNFNNFSIGIELVNFNGNIFPYREKQYETLFKTLEHLQSVYPNLKKPYRILGHEHIAGFRGKADPGRFFDWDKLYRRFYREKSALLSTKIAEKQGEALAFCREKRWNDALSQKISLIMEKPLPFWIKKQWIRSQF